MRTARTGWDSRGRRRGGSARRVYIVVFGVCIAAFVVAVNWNGRPEEAPERLHRLSAIPSAELAEATRASADSFKELLVRPILDKGRLTVTLHVALTNGEGKTTKFTDGDDPRTNLCWGALFGIDTHLANAAGWDRVYRDRGDGTRVIRRSVFSRRVTPSAAWLAEGVSDGFDIYVLANAWPASRMKEAMSQPVRDAFTDAPVLIEHDGLRLEFGSASCMVGYLGPNAMADAYWNPFEGLPPLSKRRIGVFYLSSMSAVYLYDSVVRHGLYPVLFARQPIVTEAYLFDGMMAALISGELDGGFVAAAAGEYAKYQRGVSAGEARAMLFR